MRYEVAYADVIAVNCIDICDKRNTKALCHEGGDAVLIGGLTYEVWRYIMLLEKASGVLAKA